MLTSLTWQGWNKANLYWPDIWASTLCNNTFSIGWRKFNASCTSNHFRLFTSTGYIRIEHLDNKLKWNAAERYSICCRGKVLNLQGHNIQASGFIGCVLDVALDKGQKGETVTLQKTTQTVTAAKKKKVLDDRSEIFIVRNRNTQNGGYTIYKAYRDVTKKLWAQSSSQVKVINNHVRIQDFCTIIKSMYLTSFNG